MPESSRPRFCRAALFDLDGTLVRTFIDFDKMRREMHALSARLGTDAATADEPDVLAVVRKMAAALPAEQAATAQSTAFHLLEQIEEAGCQNSEEIPGAQTLLRNLRSQNIPVAVLTRNCRRIAGDLLLRHRLNFHVNLLLAREDTAQFKPHPEPVRRACREIKVSAAESVVIGDLWADVAAGRAAGARTVGIHWPHDPPDRFVRCIPDICAASLEAAIPPLLNLLGIGFEPTG